MSHVDVTRKLREVGLRVTPQRVAVLDYLLGVHDHPTAEQVGHSVNERFPMVSRASVYNVLHCLARAGLVREVFAGDALTRYDAMLEPHHHFVCRACGGVEDLPLAVARVEASASLGQGRTNERCEVMFHGICKGCA